MLRMPILASGRQRETPASCGLAGGGTVPLMSSRRPAFLLLLVLALVAASCGDSETSTESTSETSAPTTSAASAEDPTTSAEPESTTTTAASTTEAEPAADVYDAPGDLELPLDLPEAAPGTIIDTEDLDISWAVGQRIAYHSTSTSGENIAVTGFVAYPTREAPVGGWPLIAWAHGTTGLGDSCAPSHQAERDALAQALVTLGFAVVATDYEGLGTPGTHPYVVGPSEAHSVLDSVRAVFELGLPVTDEWVAFGHSQGGHAAMFTGQLQPTYAPELNMIGVVAGAPPSQQETLGDALVGGDFQGYLPMTAAGLVAAYDQLQLTDILSAEAIELIDVIETGCTADIFEVYNPLDYDDVAIAEAWDLPEWRSVLIENDTNQLPVEAPLFILHGGEDEQIPVGTSATLLSQLCEFDAQGPTIRKVYEGQSHAGVLTSGAALPDFLAWVNARFAGEPAPTDC